MDVQRAISALTREGFAVRFFDTAAEAADYLAESISGKTVGIGGSMTIEQLGLYDRLTKDNTVFWHWKTDTLQTRLTAANADVYLTSANAIAETGEIINIDGSGNRLSESLFGPKRVYYVIGKNKIAPDLSSAMDRARNIACPKNAARFNKKTPCVVSDDKKCYDCNSPERICNAILILERPCTGMEVEMVFINEDLGY